MKTEPTMQEEFNKRLDKRQKGLVIPSMEEKLRMMRILFESDVKVFLEVTAKGVFLQAIERKRDDEACEDCGGGSASPDNGLRDSVMKAMKEATKETTKQDVRPAYFG